MVGIAVVPVGSTTLYVIVPAAKTGDKVPVFTVKELRVASVEAAATLKVTVYVFVVEPSWAVTKTVPDPLTEVAWVITLVACDSFTMADMVGIVVVP
jgi:hypothetical protein